jgi:hypothetical protein
MLLNERAPTLSANSDAYRYRSVATSPVVVRDCTCGVTGEDPTKIREGCFETNGCHWS